MNEFEKVLFHKLKKMQFIVSALFFHSVFPSFLAYFFCIECLGYCRVIGNTTTVNTYIDIYCSLVSHTVVLSTVAESHGLTRICYWSHASSVDQLTLGEGLLVGDALLRTRSRQLQSAAVAGNGCG